MSDYYDRQGNPIDDREWSATLRTQEYRRVAKSSVGEYDVSTVWLGLDHGWGDGPPLIFETMVFGTGPMDQECVRYSSEAEARNGHAEMVKRVEFALRCQFADLESATNPDSGA